jgi:hypothetical protein
VNQEERTKKMQKVIAKAWADEEFKRKLIAQPAETLREEGLDAPPEVELRVVESTDKVVYIVLPPNPSSTDAEIQPLTRRTAYNSCSCPCCF